MDRYELMDNGTLVFERQSPRRQQIAYMTDEFCFEINKDAKRKFMIDPDRDIEYFLTYLKYHLKNFQARLKRPFRWQNIV